MHIFNARKIIKHSLVWLLPAAALLLPALAAAQEFVQLQPLPGISGDPTKNLGAYFNEVLRLAIVIAAILAVVQITIGGITYMTSEAIPAKTAGMEKVKNALIGLLLILGSWLILYTINPDLVVIDFF